MVVFNAYTGWKYDLAREPRKTHKHHTPGKFSPRNGKTWILSTNCFPQLSLQNTVKVCKKFLPSFPASKHFLRTSWSSVMVVYWLRFSRLDNGHSIRVLLVIPFNDAVSATKGMIDKKLILKYLQGMKVREHGNKWMWQYLPTVLT